MRKTSVHILLPIVLLACLSGCTSTVRQMTLFAFDGGEFALSSRPLFVLSAGDKLQISVSATDKDAVEVYNAAGNEFYVEDDGTVLLPVLGRVALAGKTEKEAAALLTEKIGGQLREPFVTLHVINAAIAVLGEVREPQQIPIDQPVSLAEALGIAKGLTDNARRDNIMVQRLEGQKMKIYRINLQTDDIFTSPCYYLQKGDVVYVSPLHSVKSSNRQL